MTEETIKKFKKDFERLGWNVCGFQSGEEDDEGNYKLGGMYLSQPNSNGCIWVYNTYICPHNINFIDDNTLKLILRLWGVEV